MPKIVRQTPNHDGLLSNSPRTIPLFSLRLEFVDVGKSVFLGMWSTSQIPVTLHPDAFVVELQLSSDVPDLDNSAFHLLVGVPMAGNVIAQHGVKSLLWIGRPFPGHDAHRLVGVLRVA